MRDAFAIDGGAEQGNEARNLHFEGVTHHWFVDPDPHLGVLRAAGWAMDTSGESGVDRAGLPSPVWSDQFQLGRLVAGQGCHTGKRQ